MHVNLYERETTRSKKSIRVKTIKITTLETNQTLLKDLSMGCELLEAAIGDHMVLLSLHNSHIDPERQLVKSCTANSTHI